MSIVVVFVGGSANEGRNDKMFDVSVQQYIVIEQMNC
jgi:hypothetical protein